MGYYTYISGGATIEPQIPEADWLYDLLEEGDSYFILRQEDGDEDVQLVNGQITVVGQNPGVTKVDFRYDDSVKAYDFDERLNELLDWVKTNGAKINGYFNGDGEESEDFWRVEIRDNIAKTEGGSIVYPSERLEPIAERGRDKHNHGHIIPRPDGQRTQCGGAPQCPDCQADRDWLAKALYH